MKSYSFFLAHLKLSQRLHYLFWAIVTIAMYCLYKDQWLQGSQWISLFALITILVFSLGIKHIERSHAPIERRYQYLSWAAFSQSLTDVFLITIGIHLSGGPFSPLTLNYIIYLGVISTFYPTRQITILNLTAITIYSGLMLGYSYHLYQPAVFPSWLPPYIGLEYTPIVHSVNVFVMLANGFIIFLHSRKAQLIWQDADIQNRYLDRLHNLSRIGLERVNSGELYMLLASEIHQILGSDCIYITRWDEDSELVHPGGVSGGIGQTYLAMQPISRREPTLTLSVWKAGKFLVAQNVFCTPYLSPKIAQQFPAKSLLAMPLYGLPNRRFLGALLVGYNKTHDFAPDEIERTQQVADIAALLISRTRLYHETQRRAGLLEQLAEQITELTSDLQRTTLLPAIVESARNLLDAQRAALHLHDRKSNTMRCEYSVGLSNAYLEHMSKYFDTSPDAEAFQKQNFVLIPDVHRDNRTSPIQSLIAREKFRAYAIFALESPQGSLGTLSLYWDQPHAISSEDVTVGLLFARRAGALLYSAVQYEKASEESLTDVLTGLPNRRFLDKRLLEESKRSNYSLRPFALLMIDLDGFKAVNDTFGHQIGDSVIQQISTALQRTVRSADMVARYGGDEFAVILPEAELELALQVAEKLKAALASTKLHLPNETQRYLSACVGIAIYPTDSDNIDALFEMADKRLYRAKRKGGMGTIICDDEN